MKLRVFEQYPTLVLLAVALLVSAPNHALAVLSQAALDDVGIVPPANAALPLSAVMTDEAGNEATLGGVLAPHPASIVIFSDYTCRSVCGTALAMAATALEDPALSDLDVGLVSLSIDPKDGPAEARTMRDSQIPSASSLAARTRFMSEEAATIEALTKAAGYRYRYDSESDQFAHPVAALVVDAEGRVGRILPSLSLVPKTLRLALVETGQGRVGGLLDQIRLRCYAFDPALGIYRSQIDTVLRAAGILTVMLLALFLLGLVRRGRRQEGSA